MEDSIYVASPHVLTHTLHRSLDIWEEESLVLNVNIIFGWFIITTEIHGRVLHDDNDETATIGSS